MHDVDSTSPWKANFENYSRRIGAGSGMEPSPPPVLSPSRPVVAKLPTLRPVSDVITLHLVHLMHPVAGLVRECLAETAESVHSIFHILRFCLPTGTSPPPSVDSSFVFIPRTQRTIRGTVGQLHAAARFTFVCVTTFHRDIYTHVVPRVISLCQKCLDGILLFSARKPEGRGGGGGASRKENAGESRRRDRRSTGKLVSRSRKRKPTNQPANRCRENNFHIDSGRR